MAADAHPDTSKSLQELDGQHWGEPSAAPTPMVGRVLELRRKPFRDLTDGEVRLAVGQSVGLRHVLPLAVERLRPNPLLDADNYPGDLLAALIRLDAQVWTEWPDLHAELAELFRLAMARSPDETESLRESLQLPSSGGAAH
jgi:hypothetical protein